MKKLILLATLFLMPQLMNCGEVSIDSSAASDPMVWICDSENAYAYHKDRDCKGLGRCKSCIRQVPLSKAKEMGKKKPCKICC